MALRTERVRIDRGGYDPSGRYWGTGGPLYRVSGEYGGKDIDTHVRAAGSAEARRKVEVSHGGRQRGAKELGYLAIYDRVEKLRRAVRNTPPTRETNKRFLRSADLLRARIRSLNPDDIAWRFFYGPFENASRKIASGHSYDVELASRELAQALESLAAVASRATDPWKEADTKAAARDPRRARRRALAKRPTSRSRRARSRR